MNIIRTAALVFILFSTAVPAWAIETLGYETVEEFNGIEIRRYDEHLLASVKVS